VLKRTLQLKLIYIAAFLSQQAAEKALKALFICKLRDSPGKTHSFSFWVKM